MTEPRFEDPPVREVRLTIFFDALPTLQSLGLAQLIVNWTTAYPKTAEVPPRRPWRGAPEPSIELLTSNAAWPMPLCTLTNSEESQAIEFQSDRFGIAWRFEPGKSNYPGFEALSKELLLRFGEFERAVKSVIDTEVRPAQVTLSYTNHVAGYAAEQLVLGILTRWQERKSPVRANYTGLRMHYCSVDERDTALTIAVDTAEESEDDRTPSAELTLDATRDVEFSKQLAESFGIAHAAILRSFLDITSDAMKRRWVMK